MTAFGYYCMQLEDAAYDLASIACSMKGKEQ
jgi:hypothetical protein